MELLGEAKRSHSSQRPKKVTKRGQREKIGYKTNNIILEKNENKIEN